jgi:hypothetical protein
MMIRHLVIMDWRGERATKASPNQPQENGGHLELFETEMKHQSPSPRSNPTTTRQQQILLNFTTEKFYNKKHSNP